MVDHANARAGVSVGKLRAPRGWLGLSALWAVTTVAAAMVASCSSSVPSSTAPPSHESGAAPSEPAEAPSAPAPKAGTTSSAAPSPAPESLAPPPVPIPVIAVQPGSVETVKVAADHAVFVVHGEASVDEVLLYMHGVCGDPHAFESWAPVVAKFGTLISLVADKPCEGSSRFRWSSNYPAIDRRVSAAIEAVAAVRGAELDGEEITVMGYSQGAMRAEGLVAAFPARYRRAVLMGGPHAPEIASLADAQSVLLMAGEKDRTAHLRAVVEPLLKAGIRAEFLAIPGAGHGEYGPEPQPVMERALGWVLDAEGASQGPSDGS